MADVQNEVNNEVAKDLPIVVRLLLWGVLAIVAFGILGYGLHSLTVAVK